MNICEISIVKVLVSSLFCMIKVEFCVFSLVMMILFSFFVVMVELMVVVDSDMMVVMCMFLRISGVVSGSFIRWMCCVGCMFVLFVVLRIFGWMFCKFVSVFLKIGNRVYRNSVIIVGYVLKFSIGIVNVSMVSGGKDWLKFMMVCDSGRNLVFDLCVISMV